MSNSKSAIDPDLAANFIDDAFELLEKTEQCFLNLEKAHDDPSIIEEILRLAHNFKGSAGAVGFSALAEFTHQLETLLIKVKSGIIPIDPEVISLLLACSDHLNRSVSGLKADYNSDRQDHELLKRVQNRISGVGSPTVATPPSTVEPRKELAVEVEKGQSTHNVSVVAAQVGAPDPDESIRVKLNRIDRLMNNVGELVILQTVMSQTRDQLHSALQRETVGQMEKIIREVQEISMSLRMVPLAQTFNKMQRIVRDTALKLSKNVEFRLSGEDIELEKTVLEQIGDPLVHLLRNAVDHGLESSDVRVRAGKNPAGKIHLGAYQSGAGVVLEITDDGRGLDPKKLRARAVEKGILKESEAAELSDEAAHHLIFAPGFSTKDEVTDVSGRGVGMDVVKTNIEILRGDISIETNLGKGTTFRITLPLSLAVIDGMIVQLGNERYVVPLAQIAETIEIDRSAVSTVAGRDEVIRLRSETVPMTCLNHLFGLSVHRSGGLASAGIVTLNSDKTPHCIVVDRIICQQQIVIKKLGPELNGLPGITGAAILGDGEAVLIVDLLDLLQRRKRRQLGSRSSHTYLNQISEKGSAA